MPAFSIPRSLLTLITLNFDSTLNSESYYEAGLPEDTVEELGGITTVKLQLTSDGQVSEISFSVIVL